MIRPHRGAPAAAAASRRRRPDDPARAAPGGPADAGDVRRGVGFAVGFKNLMYAEGYDGRLGRRRAGWSTDWPRVTLRGRRGRPGFRHAGPADRPHRARRRRRARRAAPTPRSARPAPRRPAARPGCRAARSSRRASAVRDAAACTCAADDAVCRSSRVAASTAGVQCRRRDASTCPWPTPRRVSCSSEDASSTTASRHPLDGDGQGDAHVSLACAAPPRRRRRRRRAGAGPGRAGRDRAGCRAAPQPASQ